MKRLIVALFLLAMTIASAAQQHHPYKCTNATGKGNYGYSCSGVATNPLDGLVEPFAAYGVVTGDGKGQWDGYGKVSFNGKLIVPWTHKTRPYAPSIVNPDCTGSVTYEVTVAGYPQPDAHFDFVIVNGGQEIKGFPTDAGYAVVCQLIQLSDDR